MELESGNNRKISKYLEIHTLQNNPWIKEEIMRKIGKYFKLNNNKNVTLKCVGCS